MLLRNLSYLYRGLRFLYYQNYKYTGKGGQFKILLKLINTKERADQVTD